MRARVIFSGADMRPMWTPWLTSALFALGCNSTPQTPPRAAAPSETAATNSQAESTAGQQPMPTTNATAPSELVTKELKAGSGPAIAKGATAEVHYTGWLYDPTAPDQKGT